MRSLVDGIVQAHGEGDEGPARASADESSGGRRVNEKGGIAKIGELSLLEDLLL